MCLNLFVHLFSRASMWQGGEARGPRYPDDQLRAPRTGPWATSLDRPVLQQHGLEVPRLSPSAAHFSEAVHLSLRQGRAEAHVEGTAGSRPRTFLHLLAGRGSSSVSDEVEEPSSLSVPVRKRALGKGELVRHLWHWVPSQASGSWVLHCCSLHPILHPPDPRTMPLLRRGISQALAR